MAAILKFLDMENNEIELPTGVDFGLSRKGIPIIKPIKIKNVGDITARSLILKSDTLNTLSQVGEEEYANQKLAASWKSFSLSENGEYVKTLNLGDVRPGRFVEGTKEVVENFETQHNCIFEEKWSTGITEFKENKMVFKKLNDETKGNISKRMKCAALTAPRDLEVEFNMEFNSDPEIESEMNAMLVFPFRVNCKGDGLGYLALFQYNRQENKFLASIHKHGKGMETNIDRVYGTKIFDTISFKTFDKTKKLGFKVYNNKSGYPTFEITYGGENMLLASTAGSGADSYVKTDTASDAYKTGGDFYFDWGLYDGDIDCKVSNFTIKTEELEQPIYIKTYITDEGRDKVNYKSAVEVSYIE